jgi:hypothetical protein
MSDSGRFGWKLFSLFLLCAAYYALWVWQVSPFCDRDSVRQFYYPFINSLQASEISADFLYIKGYFDSAYPFGLAFVSWIVSLLGAQDFLLSSPWLIHSINFLPVISLCLLLSYLTRSVFAGACLFFFPVTQLTLHTGSVHAFNVCWFLMGYFLLMHYQQERKSAYAIAAVLCLCFAASVKHLGLLFCVNLFLVLLFQNLKSWRTSLSFVVASILLSLFFYPWKGLNTYINVVFSHSEFLTPVTGFFLCIGMLILFLLAQKTVKYSLKKSPDLWFKNGVLFFLFLIPWIIMILFGEGRFASFIFYTMLFIDGIVTILLLRYFKFSSVREITYLFTLSSFLNGLVLYYSQVGHIPFAIYVPLILSLFLYCLECKNKLLHLVLASFFFALSTFFPSAGVVQDKLGVQGLNIYTLGFNGLHLNPLSFRYSGFRHLRKQYVSFLKSFQFQEEFVPVVFYGLHSHTMQQLELKSMPGTVDSTFIRINDMRERFLARIKQDYESSLTEVFGLWCEQGIFPVLVEGVNPYTKSPYFYQSLNGALKEVEAEELSYYLNDDYFRYLKQHDSLLTQFYDSKLFSEGDFQIRVYIHKSISRKVADGGFKDTLRPDLYYKDYLEQKLPGRWAWFAPSRETMANTLFEKSWHFWESGQRKKALQYITRAKSIAPNHKEIVKDFRIMTELYAEESGAQKQ